MLEICVYLYVGTYLSAMYFSSDTHYLNTVQNCCNS